jgi:methyltransferase
MPITLILAVGWLLHLGFWTWALFHAGRGAARREEWPREAALRAAMLALVLAALLWPRGEHVHLGAASRALLVIVFLGGQALAVVARLSLAGAWGVGVKPREGVSRVRSGPYRLWRHPIYAGTGVAILAQAALLQNVPALAMAVGAAALIPIKVLAERAAVRPGL